MGCGKTRPLRVVAGAVRTCNRLTHLTLATIFSSYFRDDFGIERLSMSIRSITVALVFLAAGTGGVVARQIPSEAELRRLLANPQAGEAIRQQLLQSGLTPDQIRSRLQAEGLSTGLLDSYIRGQPGGQLVPNDSVFGALSAIGLGTAYDLAAFADALPLVGMRDGAAVDSIVVDRVAYELFVEKHGEDLADSLLLYPRRGLRLFGLEVFRRASNEFAPDLAGPVGEDYRLGAGDALVLILTGDVEAAYTLQVTREGLVLIPQVGQVFVNNLSLGQVRAILARRLGEAYSGLRSGTTQFDLTVARVRMAQVFVLGDVVRPGSYQLPSVSTVLTALYLAGGPTELGSLREITVRRGTDTVAVLDFYEYLQTGATRGDIRLESGDVVFVPVHGPRVKIAGGVVRPGVYELKSGETLADLMKTAGGFTADAALERLSVSRIVPASERTPGTPAGMMLDVKLEHHSDVSIPPFALEPGDSVTAFVVDSTRRAMLEVKGAVYLPGTFGWRPGIRLSQVIELAGGFKPAVYTDRAHIERLNPADSTRLLINVVLPADSSQPYPDDVVLHDYDIVTIYGRDQFHSERTVSIGGMVNKPGGYPYRAGMTIRDLVMMAQGLSDGAFLDSAEIGRLPPDRTGGQLAVTIRVPLDSTYLLEPDSTSYAFLPGPPTETQAAPEVPLEPFDRVTILQQPDFELQRTVWITGEVAFPGPYTLTRKDERASDLVSRAGGFLQSAYPEGGRFFRRMDNAGRVNLELARAVQRPGSREDLILQPDDSLHVPEYLATVQVVGEVISPTSVLFREGASLSYYIGNAGGYARNADKGRTSVRYANGSARVRSKFLFFSSTPTPGPGSTVFVPQRDRTDRFDVTRFVTSLVSVVGSITTVILVLTR